MKIQKHLLILALGFCLSAGSTTRLFSDELKLKNGETIIGRITYEAADIVKIEVTVSASIKETKIISRADVAEIVKDAPDVVEFNRLQKLLPTGSLIPAGTYRQLLESGPDAFLKAYPGSTLAPKVQEIRNTLASELDKVERGYIKLETDWISPQEKIDFKELIESRIRFLSMDGHAKSGNFNGFVAAMKEFETLEENYLGSPAFPRAVELALQIIPTLGRQLQTMARDIDYRNAEYERALQASTPESREQLTAAKAKDEKAFQDRVAAEKKEGIRWIALNPGMKSSIEEYLKLASGELARIRDYDLNLLRSQAEQLVAADKLIAENKIAEARTKLADAAALTGQKTDSKTTKTKSKSKSKGPASAGSYIASLNAKINERLAEEQVRAKEKSAAEKSEALAANLKAGTGEKAASGTESEAPPVTDAAEGGPKPEEAKMPEQSPVDEFAALAASKKEPKSDAKEKSGAAKKPKPARNQPPEDSDEALTPPVIEEEGGFPKWLIVPMITVLLIVVVVVLKVLGIGGKKAAE